MDQQIRDLLYSENCKVTDKFDNGKEEFGFVLLPCHVSQRSISGRYLDSNGGKNWINYNTKDTIEEYEEEEEVGRISLALIVCFGSFPGNPMISFLQTGN